MNLQSAAVLIVLGMVASFSTGCANNPTIADNGAVVKANTAELDYGANTQDYRIGASDLLDIKVFQADELSREVRVDTRGFITLPLLGSIQVAGLTQAQTEQKLADLMRQSMLQNPQVTVFIKEYTSQRVTIEGEVKKPGVYPIKGQATLLQSIAMAGGLENLADAQKIVLFRQQGAQNKAFLIDLKAIRAGQAKDPVMRNDDRIVVHRSDSRFWMREAATLLSPFTALNSIVN